MLREMAPGEMTVEFGMKIGGETGVIIAEEMLTTCPAGERAEFLDRVLPPTAVDEVPYRLVCTLRADFLRPLLEHADVAGRLQDRLLPLSPMSVATLERAVSEPARVRGVRYDDGLARQIAIDAAGGCR